MLRPDLAVVGCLVATSVVGAASVTFHLIAPSTTTVTPTVSIVGGQSLTMTAPTPGVPHYTATADVSDGAKYKYSVGGTTETFERTLPSGRSQTDNDFFQRAITVKKLPQFPWPLESEGITTAQWQRAAPRQSLFNDSYIPTLYFAGAGDIDGKVEGGETVSCTLYIVLQDRILMFPETKWYPYKSDTWKWGSLIQLTQNVDAVGGRTWFKARTGEFDPTNLREKTYTDMMNALGVPVAQQIHARFYANGKPLGLFILTDLVTNLAGNQQCIECLDNHVFHVFEGGESARLKDTGIPLICGTGATMEYVGDNPEVYNACYGSKMYTSGPRMVELAKKLSLVGASSSEQQLKDLADIFDIDIFLRQMVMEYLAVNWDGYWDQSSNFIMYWDEYQTQKWYFTDNDFDQTFGSANAYEDGPDKSYKTYPGRPASVGRPVGPRPLIENLLATQKYRQRFEHILIEMVKHTFNPVAFNRRMDVFTEILRPEIRWDHSFKADGDRLFTADDFDKGMTGIVVYRGSNNSGVGNGLYSWVNLRAQAVAKEFNFQWDSEAKDPPDIQPNISLALNLDTVKATVTPSGKPVDSTVSVGFSLLQNALGLATYVLLLYAGYANF